MHGLHTLSDHVLERSTGNFASATEIQVHMLPIHSTWNNFWVAICHYLRCRWVLCMYTLKIASNNLVGCMKLCYVVLDGEEKYKALTGVNCKISCNHAVLFYIVQE